MPLSTYANLKAAVADWCHRTDLTTQIVDFVALAEAQIRRDVRCRAMQILTTGTLTGEVLAQPTRYLEAERLVLEDVEQDFVAPGMYAQLKQAQSTEPKYTHIGTDIYFLNGASGDDYSILYWQQFAPFSADADTNWLLTNAPEIYLSGALVQAAVYLNDDAMMTRHAAIYQASVKLLNSAERRSQFSGSRLEIRAN
jgi:hypothetical protein